MPTDSSSTTRRVISASIAVVGAAVIVELIGHLTNGTPTATAVAGGVVGMAAGLGTAGTKQRKRRP